MDIARPTSTLTVNVDQSTFDTLTWSRGDVVTLDEIRFGNSLAAVAGLEIFPIPTYATWSFGAAADEDTNGDGVANAIAWALGTPGPSANATGLLPTLDSTSDANHVIFNFNRSDAANDDPKTTIMVEYGNNLAGWTTATHDGANVIIETTPGIPTDAVKVKLKRTTLGATGRIFARLKVVVTP